MYNTSKMKKIWRKLVIWLKGTNQISIPSPFWLAVCCLLEMADDGLRRGLTDDAASKKYIL